MPSFGVAVCWLSMLSFKGPIISKVAVAKKTVNRVEDH
jgi:hypothetical protein